jgi:hypothetical protein
MPVELPALVQTLYAEFVERDHHGRRRSDFDDGLDGATM